jgi:hypothetical protein
MLTKVLRRGARIVASKSVGFRPNITRQLLLNDSRRYFSDNEELKEKMRKIKEDVEAKQKKESGIEDERAESNSKSIPTGPSPFEKSVDMAKKGLQYFIENVRLAYDEMLGNEKESILQKKKIHFDEVPTKKKQDDDDDDDNDKPKEEVPAGPSSIVLVKEGKSAWEQMKDRLQDSPFIREILKQTKNAGKVAASTDIGKKAQDLGKTMKEKVEDVREFWETSQNPIVYAVSGVWENLTGETEEGIATSAIRKLDPGFYKEEWAAEVKENLVPKIIKAHLEGDIKTLKPWLADAVFNKLSADVKARKHDQIVFDSRVLHIEENTIIMKFLEDGGPIIVVIYMVQQINCIRKKGEIIEVSNSAPKTKGRKDMMLISMQGLQYYIPNSLPIIFKYSDDNHKLCVYEHTY